MKFMWESGGRECDECGDGGRRVVLRTAGGAVLHLCEECSKQMRKMIHRAVSTVHSGGVRHGSGGGGSTGGGVRHGSGGGGDGGVGGGGGGQ